MGIHRPDLATEEPEESRGPWRRRLQAGLFGGLFEWWTEGFDKSPRSWIRVLREALIDFFLEWAYGGEGKSPDPGKRRREAALGYCLMVFGGLVILWAARQDDVSKVMATVGGFVVLAGGWLAWRGSRRVGDHEPPIELGLARKQKDDNPAM